MKKNVVSLKEARESKKFTLVKGVKGRVLFVYFDKDAPDGGDHDRRLYELKGGPSALHNEDGELHLLVTFHQICKNGSQVVEFFTSEGNLLPEVKNLLEAREKFSI